MKSMPLKYLYIYPFNKYLLKVYYTPNIFLVSRNKEKALDLKPLVDEGKK